MYFLEKRWKAKITMFWGRKKLNIKNLELHATNTGRNCSCRHGRDSQKLSWCFCIKLHFTCWYHLYYTHVNGCIAFILVDLWRLFPPCIIACFCTYLSPLPPTLVDPQKICEIESNKWIKSRVHSLTSAQYSSCCLDALRPSVYFTPHRPTSTKNEDNSLAQRHVCLM